MLPLLSKVYERVVYEETLIYFEPFFTESLCGFKKAHSTHQALFNPNLCWLFRGFFEVWGE